MSRVLVNSPLLQFGPAPRFFVLLVTDRKENIIPTLKKQIITQFGLMIRLNNVDVNNVHRLINYKYMFLWGQSVARYNTSFSCSCVN